jgi:hypothetical protein
VAAAATGAFHCVSASEMAIDEATRVRLGARSDATQDELHALAEDESVTVRAALALNPATSAETNAVLALDPDERVRALLGRKLAALAPSLSAGVGTRLQQQTYETLTALARDEAVRVRAAIAEVVKDLPDAPRALIALLAWDEAGLVYEPVILFSPLLTAEDLVSLVVHAPSVGTRLAVARRHAIDEQTSDALALDGTDNVVMALLSNASAQIRESTLDALVENSSAYPNWHEPLIRRPTLSVRSLKTLCRIVADHLLDVLAGRTGLDAATAADLRGRVRARLKQHPETEPSVSPPAPEPEGRIGQASTHTESDLLEAARQGDARKVAIILALASGMALPLVRRAATLRSAKGLISLAWKAGFTMKSGYAAQLLLARLSPGAAIKPGPGNAFPLSVQEMCWQLDFLNGRAS